MEDSIQFAKKYLEDILSFFGLNTSVDASADDGEVIELRVPTSALNGFLIGQNGDTMRSLQYVVGSALKNQGYEYFRVNLDIAEYKKQRADRLAEKAMEWVNKVKATSESLPLEPMNAADRRTIHKLAADEGLATESVGEGQERHIVLKPAK